MQTQPEPSLPTSSKLPVDVQPREIFDEETLRETFERGIAARLKRLELAQSIDLTRTVIEKSTRQIDQEKGIDLASAARIVNLILRQEISRASKLPGQPEQWDSPQVTAIVRRLRRLTTSQREAINQFYLERIRVENIQGMQPEDFRKLKASLKRSYIKKAASCPSKIPRGPVNTRKAS